MRQPHAWSRVAGDGRSGRGRIARFAALLGLALATVAGTCVVVEEGPPGAFEGPGENQERMEEQEYEIMDDEDR